MATGSTGLGLTLVGDIGALGNLKPDEASAWNRDGILNPARYWTIKEAFASNSTRKENRLRRFDTTCEGGMCRPDSGPKSLANDVNLNDVDAG